MPSTFKKSWVRHCCHVIKNEQRWNSFAPALHSEPENHVDCRDWGQNVSEVVVNFKLKFGFFGCLKKIGVTIVTLS